MDRTDPLFDTAALGAAAEEFLKTPLGDYIIQRAKEETEKAVEGLKTANPETKAGRIKIRKLQNQVQICESVISWLGDAIVEGSQAKQVLEDSHG